MSAALAKQSGEYVEDIIRYFENLIKDEISIHQFTEQEKNNKNTFTLSLSNVILIIFVAVLTIMSNQMNSGLDRIGQIENRLIEISKMEPSNFTALFLNNTAPEITAAGTLISIAGSGINAIFFVACAMLGMNLLYLAYNEYSTGKRMRELETEINSVGHILTSLYLIKIKWGHKLTEQDVKKSLIKFYISTKDYEQMLLGLIDKFEGEEQSAQGTVKDALAIKPA